MTHRSSALDPGRIPRKEDQEMGHLSQGDLAVVAWRAVLRMWKAHLTLCLCFVGALVAMPFAWMGTDAARTTFALRLRDLTARVTAEHRPATGAHDRAMSEHRRRKALARGDGTP